MAVIGLNKDESEITKMEIKINIKVENAINRLTKKKSEH